MTHLPHVLGLPQDEAESRLRSAGIRDMEILVSGRRREGRPRVIRQRMRDEKAELIVSFFKDLKI